MDLSSSIMNEGTTCINAGNGNATNHIDGNAYGSQVNDEYTATVCTPSLLRLVQNEVEQPKKVQFPNHLHSLLHNTNDEIVSWNQQGTAFCIHDRAQFMEIAPCYFKLKLFRSFTRQLNMWGFHAAGRGQTIYHHPKFQRDNVDLCYEMIRREKTKKGASSSKKSNDHCPTFVFAGEQQPQVSSPKSSTSNSPFQGAPFFTVACGGASPSKQFPSSYAEILGDHGDSNNSNNRTAARSLQTPPTAASKPDTLTCHHHHHQQHILRPTAQTPQSLSSILFNDMELIKSTAAGLPLHQTFNQPPFVGTATAPATSIGKPRHVRIKSAVSTIESAFDSVWNDDQSSWCTPDMGTFDNATDPATQQQQQSAPTKGCSFDSDKDRQLFAALFKHLETKPSLNHIHTTDIDPRPLEQMIAFPGGVL